MLSEYECVTNIPSAPSRAEAVNIVCNERATTDDSDIFPIAKSGSVVPQKFDALFSLGMVFYSLLASSVQEQL